MTTEAGSTVPSMLVSDYEFSSMTNQIEHGGVGPLGRPGRAYLLSRWEDTAGNGGSPSGGLPRPSWHQERHGGEGECVVRERCTREGPKMSEDER